ncbi:MAG: hypothetical protein R3B45_13420 [Bdellovibrionota bacterium]
MGQSTPKSDKNDTPVFETTPTELELLLSNLSIDSVDYQSFALSLPYHGDKNNNANISLHYCSVKQSLGCNPSIDGVFSNLNKNNTTF